MADEKFETNLLKLIGGELYFLISMTVSREMYGKSYFALGVGEKAAVDQAALSNVATYFQQITPDLLKSPIAKAGVGFQVQSPASSAEQIPNQKTQT